jgi:hypothetical protein
MKVKVGKHLCEVPSTWAMIWQRLYPFPAATKQTCLQPHDYEDMPSTFLASLRLSDDHSFLLLWALDFAPSTDGSINFAQIIITILPLNDFQ